MHIEVSPELVELHSKLRNVNYVARKRYGQLLPHSDMARWGSLTDEDRQTRKDLHRPLTRIGIEIGRLSSVGRASDL